MLAIDPAALGALAVYLARSEAAGQAMSDARDALEVAASKKNNETARLACFNTLYAVVHEREDALMDLEDAVRMALYGPDDDDEFDRAALLAEIGSENAARGE